MRWIKMSEKEMILAWASEEGTDAMAQRYLSVPELCESYWSQHEGEAIVEYDFDTIPELKDLLGNALTEEVYGDLIMPLAVAAFKERNFAEGQAVPDVKTVADGNQSEKALELPEYVYVF